MGNPLLVSVDSDSKLLPSPVLGALDVRNSPDKLMVSKLGAKGDGTPADIAVSSALAAAKAAARGSTGSSDPVGSKVIELPAGDFPISTIQGMLGVENMTSKVNGLRFRGAGKGLTRIIFSPSSANTLMFNDYWINIGFSGISFVTTVSGADFMRSYTTHNAQNYSFTDCEWSGPWNHVLDLQGNNNNSEFSFIGCNTTGMLNSGAFLYVGSDNTSDQFLNYWFFGFKHWSTSAALVDMAKGGSVHMYGVDASDWGAAATASSASLINLRGASHAFGVCEFHAYGLRVEAKNSNASLLYSEWPTGNVTIQADWSSQAGAFTYGPIIKIVYQNTPGPVYEFHDSQLAGGVSVSYQTNDYASRHSIRFRNTVWLQKNNPSDVVTYTRPGANFTDPQVDFINCRGGGSDVYGSAGYDVWDAVIGWAQGDLVKPIQKRQLQVRNAGGNPNSGNTYNVNLPVGAIITGMRAFAPAGDTTQGDSATFTLSTRESTPSAVASVATGVRANGYNVTTDLSIPVLLSTRAKANLALTCSNATQVGTNSVVIIDGYW